MDNKQTESTRKRDVHVLYDAQEKIALEHIPGITLLGEADVTQPKEDCGRDWTPLFAHKGRGSERETDQRSLVLIRALPTRNMVKDDMEQFNGQRRGVRRRHGRFCVVTSAA